MNKISEKMVKMYHASPEHSITVFKGRYSGKFHAKGLFVTPKLKSIYEDWAGYVAHKKSENSDGKKQNLSYSSLTVYTLAIPASVVARSEEFNNQKYQEAVEKYESDQLTGAWGWGPELFIREEDLPSIRIIGRETLDTEDISQHHRPAMEFRDALSVAKSVANSNAAAHLYLEIETEITKSILKYGKDVVQFSGAPELLDRLTPMFWKAKEGNLGTWVPEHTLNKNNREKFDQAQRDWHYDVYPRLHTPPTPEEIEAKKVIRKHIIEIDENNRRIREIRFDNQWEQENKERKTKGLPPLPKPYREYRPKTAGQGKSFQDVYVSIFGTSKPSKAFRTLAKMSKDVNLKTGMPRSTKEGMDPETVAKIQGLLTEASPVFQDLLHSHAFLSAYKEGDKSLYLGFPSNFSEAYTDPLEFISGSDLKILQWWMKTILDEGDHKIKASTAKFLRDWVNTDGSSLPHLGHEEEQELIPFRPDGVRVYYRGIRFTDIGEMLAFTSTYGNGKKPFPFESDRLSSWAKDIHVAERFGRYNPAGSMNSAMYGWAARAKDGRDYDGYGGYVIGARIHPEDCIVDLNHPGLHFGGGIHGNEGEIIVKPGAKLVAKVYMAFGDIERSVANYLKGPKNSPLDPNFYRSLYKLTAKNIRGDNESGTVEFEIDTYHSPNSAEKSPREVDAKSPYQVSKLFHEDLYDAKWISNTTIEYKRMVLPGRVASRFLNC